MIPSPPDIESLRVYLTLPFYHEFSNPKQHKKLHQPFAKAVLSLAPNPQRVIGCWWSMASREYFERLVDIFKNVVDFIIRLQKIGERQVSNYTNIYTGIQYG